MLEHFIEGLNNHIKGRREVLGIQTTGHLVLQREIILHSTFKVLKTYKYTVWFVKDFKTYEVLTLKHTVRSLTGQEESVNKDMSVTLSEMLFNWVGSSFYDEVIRGEYNGIPED